MNSFTSLSGKLLISLNATIGDYFNKTIILIIEHHQDGAFGLVVNRPINTDLSELLVNHEQFDCPKNFSGKFPLLETGPVEQSRLFFLHSNDKKLTNSVAVNEHVSVSTSIDLISAILEQKGPKDVIAGLGYAGWSAGQLEDEIKCDAWLVTPYVQNAVFNTPYEDRRKVAADAIGIELSLIGPILGNG